MPKLLTEENVDDIIYCARAGELEDLTELTQSLVRDEVLELRDALNNTPLHMASANGHLGELKLGFFFICKSKQLN